MNFILPHSFELDLPGIPLLSTLELLLFGHSNRCIRVTVLIMGDHLGRIYLNCQGIYSDRLYCFRIFDAQDWLIFVVFLYGGNIPFVVSLCFASQRIPTACPNCAGSISTIGLRSFLLQVSGVSSRLSFCCTSLVSGFIIHDKGKVVYSQSVQQMRRIFAPKIQKTGIHQLHQNVRAVCG